MASRLRTSYPAAYPAMASRVESELGLGTAPIAAELLGSIDTFQFEERVVFDHCANLIADRKWDAALSYVMARDRSFWLDQDMARRTQWEACRRMADLGRIAEEVLAEVKSVGGTAGEWVQRYSELRWLAAA